MSTENLSLDEIIKKNKQKNRGRGRGGKSNNISRIPVRSTPLHDNFVFIIYINYRKVEVEVEEV